MRIKYKLFLCAFSLVFLWGCSGNVEKEAGTTENEHEHISIGSYNTEQPTSYSPISCISGFTFDIRDRDLAGDFEINPLTVLDETQSPKYMYDWDYIFNDVINYDENVRYALPSTYYLYKQEECIYSLRTYTHHMSSLLYYSDRDVAHNELSKYMAAFGIKNIVYDEDTTQYASNIETSEYAYYSQFTAELDGKTCIGAIFASESNSKGQTFFLVAGNNNHFYQDELNHIMSSYKESSETPEKLPLPDTTTEISSDYQGVLLSGTFSDNLPFSSDQESFRYAETVKGSGYLEPYYANPFSDCILKYNVYPVPDSLSISDFMDSGMYPGITVYKKTGEIVLDGSENTWEEYSGYKEDGSLLKHYTNTSVYVTKTDYGIIAFELFYRDPFIRDLLVDAISSIVIAPGETKQTAMDAWMESIYEENFSLPEATTATGTDAIGIMIEGGENE